MSDERPEPGAGHLGPNDFSTFIIGLGSTALMHMGVGGEGADEGPPQLELARETIGMLQMLEEKTRGNLTDAEQKLLGAVLYQVRMAFVEVQKRDAG